MRQAAGSVGGSIRRLAVSVTRRALLAGRAVYHQCWSRIAFLQVLSKTVVSGTRGSRQASAMADYSAPLAGNLNTPISKHPNRSNRTTGALGSHCA